MTVVGRLGGYVLFLFSRRHRIYKLRRKYDKLRERSSKVRDSQKRLSIFNVLDQVEPNLVILEEQNVSRFERGRMIRYVSAGISKAEQILKTDTKKTEVRKTK